MDKKISKIFNAWEIFIKSGSVTEKNIVRDLIIESWQRCYNADINPDVVKALCLKPEELQQRIYFNKKMIDIAKPFMQKLYQVVKGSGFAVILLDNDGYILELVGDDCILKQHKYLRQGENWSENVKGTNAMGLVLKEQKPVQVYATEHYCSPNHMLTCSAAPIRNTDNEVIGVLDVTGDYRKAHSHTLGMVVAAVQAIENQLSLEKVTSEIIRSYENMSAIMESLSEGVLSFDRFGRITQLNKSAARILGLNIKDCKGQYVSRVLNNPNIIKSLLEQGKVLNDKEMVLDTQRGRLHFTMSGRALKDENESIFGGVITIREIKSVRNLVNKMVGAQARFTFDDIIGRSQSIIKAKELAKMVAPSNSTILLHGKSGTGKEMFAQAIHNASSFSNGPFVAINCAAIPRDLIESELFGYEEGAFTGAKKGGRPGKFELANGGTIFLDEVADMPWDVQVALLRVLQEKQVVRVGGYKPIPVEIRVIAATNKDLFSEVKKGNFREDLYYRLNVIPIYIPTLRERGEDVIIIAEYFISKFAGILGKSSLKMCDEVKQLLLSYNWPGNVRQLANVIERAVNVAEGNIIKPEHLSEELKKVRHLDTSFSKKTKLQSIEQAEKELITRTLQALSGNISQAANVLGIGRNTLYRKIKKFNIDLKELG